MSGGRRADHRLRAPRSARPDAVGERGVTPRARHARALAQVSGLVDAVPDAAWDAPTPCAGWTVRDVVGHLVWGHRVLGAGLAGAAFTEPAGGRTVPLAPPVPAAHRAAVDAALTAVRRAGPGAAVAFPAGPVGLDDALLVRVQDVVVHGWDLAVATGLAFPHDDDLVRSAERTARERRGAGALAAPHFAPALVPEGDRPLDRLLAAVGRSAPRPPTP